MEKKLYPLKFIPIQSLKPWGGCTFAKEFGKQFVEIDEDGNEVEMKKGRAKGCVNEHLRKEIALFDP